MFFILLGVILQACLGDCCHEQGLDAHQNSIPPHVQGAMPADWLITNFKKSSFSNSIG